MKKSKVIIPAMAMILFSTAASISGTVAWFTASRVFETTVGQFQVARLDGSLDATMAAGVGTVKIGDSIYVGKATSGENPTLDATKPHYLVDASFNHKTGKAYKLSRDAAGVFDEKNAYTAVNTANPQDWLFRSVPGTGVTTDYYVAVSWTITFSYEFVDGESTNVGIFFNFDNSAVNMPQAHTVAANTKNAAKGFRIAFMGGDHGLVWGDLADATATDGVSSTNTDNDGHSGKYTYVSAGGNSSAVADYVEAASGASVYGSGAAAYDFFKAGVGSGTLPDDGASGNTTRSDRVGTILYSAKDANNKATVAITCVAWFEGSDPNIQNGTVMEALGAKLSFYSRLDPASN